MQLEKKKKQFAVVAKSKAIKKGKVGKGVTLKKKVMPVKKGPYRKNEEIEESENDSEENEIESNASDEEEDMNVPSEEEDNDSEDPEEEEEEADDSEDPEEEEDADSDDAEAEDADSDDAVEEDDDSDDAEEEDDASDDAEEEDDASDAEKDGKSKKVSKTKKEKPEPKPFDPMQTKRTMYIGNLSKDVTKTLLINTFKKFGEIESVRLRDHTGRPVSRQAQRDKAKHIFGFLVFKEQDSVAKACKLNGEKLNGSRMRLTPQDVKPMGDPNATVFVGNIDDAVTEDELHELFATVGEIDYVRLISNKRIAFVCFKKGVSTQKALKLDQHDLKGRALRVLPHDTNKSNTKKNKKGHLVPRKRGPQTSGKKSPGKSAAKGKDSGKGNFLGKVANKGDNDKKKKTFSKAAKGKKAIADKLKAAKVVKAKK